MNINNISDIFFTSHLQKHRGLYVLFVSLLKEAVCMQCGEWGWEKQWGCLLKETHQRCFSINVLFLSDRNHMRFAIDLLVKLQKCKEGVDQILGRGKLGEKAKIVYHIPRYIGALSF